jgi:glucose dehydrogenase
MVITLPVASREVKLVDATGRVVTSVPVNGASKWELDVSALAPGSYTVAISGSELLRSQRVIIAR